MITLDKEKEWRVARENLIYHVVAGSRSHGTDTESSDLDTRGVYIPSPEGILGLNPMGHLRRIVGGEDTVLIPLREAALNFSEGGITWVEILFVDPSHILMENIFWSMLREHRRLFLTKKMVEKTCSFMRGMRRDTAKKITSTDPEKVDDARKAALHAVRSGRMLEEMFSTGKLRVYRPEERDSLLHIRYGGESIDSALEEIDKRVDKITEMSAESLLANDTDLEAVEQIVVHTTRQYWARKYD